MKKKKKKKGRKKERNEKSTTFISRADDREGQPTTGFDGGFPRIGWNGVREDKVHGLSARSKEDGILWRVIARVVVGRANWARVAIWEQFGHWRSQC